MSNRTLIEFVLLDAQDENGEGNGRAVSDYRHKTVEIATAGTANLKVKIQISMQKLEPDWSAAADARNRWTYCAAFDLSTTTKIEGPDGVVFAAADGVVTVVVNEDNVRWVNAQVTDWVAGTANAKLIVADNE